MITITGVAEYIRKALIEGKPTQCNDCGQRVARYKITLNSGMAMSLIWLAKASKYDSNSWIHIQSTATRMVLASRSYPKLQHWGLIEPSLNLDPTKKDSGKWRITEKGLRFVRAEESVPSFYLVYDNKVLEWSDRTVSIVGALGKKFDYRKVLEEKI